MSPAGAGVSGDCDPAFDAVRHAFEENFRERDEIGASVCVRVAGRRVVDLWGGATDETRAHPWQRDTLVNAYSVGKGVTALLVLRLVEKGLLDLDEPVTRRWPEYAAEGKADTTLRMLLAHRGGLPGVREALPDDAWQHWDGMTAALAATRPFWKPGTAHGYHTNTYGFLVGELVRRVTGLRFGVALRELLTGPCDADFHIGLPRSEHARVARVCGFTTTPASEEEILAFVKPTGDAERDLMRRHCYFNPPGISGGGTVNTEAWRLAEIPSTNGHATARSVATLYAAALSGRAEIGASLLAEARRIHSDGEDRVLERASRFGLGFQIPSEGRRIGRGPECFGHYGHGGSIGFADAESGVAFGYLTNLPGPRWQAPRSDALIDALYTCL